jgi:hypothetical protein
MNLKIKYNKWQINDKWMPLMTINAKESQNMSIHYLMSQSWFEPIIQ